MKVGQYDLIKSDKISLRQKLFLFFILLSMIPVFFTAKSLFTAFAQTKLKKEKVIKKVSFENEPIEFLNLESNGKAVNANEKFIQEDDWLKDFTIKFKNVSGKSITYVSIVISFPETGPNGLPMAYFLKYGVLPIPDKNGVLPPSKTFDKEKTRLLAPNDTAEIVLSQENFKALKQFLLSRNLLSDLTEVNFRIMSVQFEDGTHYVGGTYWVPDPMNAGKFIPAENKSQEEEK